jgi:hypothetical protein
MPQKGIEKKIMPKLPEESGNLCEKKINFRLEWSMPWIVEKFEYFGLYLRCASIFVIFDNWVVLLAIAQ